jgi:hypothetical protein
MENDKKYENNLSNMTPSKANNSIIIESNYNKVHKTPEKELKTQL